MGMRYFRKWLEDEGRYQYEERESDSSDASMTEITKEKYLSESAKQWAEYTASLLSGKEEKSSTPSVISS